MKVSINPRVQLTIWRGNQKTAKFDGPLSLVLADHVDSAAHDAIRVALLTCDFLACNDAAQDITWEIRRIS